MGVGSDFTITHDNDIGATISGSPITITSAEASTWSTSGGVLTISGKTGLNLQEDGTNVISINTDRDIVIGNTTATETISIGHTTSETTVNDNLTVTGNLEVDGGLDNTKFQSYAEHICTAGQGITQSSATIEMNMAEGNVFYYVRTGNCTTLSFINMIAGQSATFISKNSASSAFTNTFANFTVNTSVLSDANILFPGGEPPGASTGTNEVDIFTFFWDGTNIYIMTGGLNFS